MLAYIQSKQWHDIGIVITENPYKDGMLDALQRNAGSGEQISIIDRYPTGNVDMASSVTKLKKHQYDAVGVFLVPGQIGTFFKLMARQKVTTPSFGSNCLENDDEIRLSDGTMEDAVYIHNEVNPSFLDRYQKAYGNKSQLTFGSMAYEFASLVGLLFPDANSQIAPDEVMKRFADLQTMEGRAIGPYTLVKEANGDRFINFPMAMKKIKGSSFEVLLRSKEALAP